MFTFHGIPRHWFLLQHFLVSFSLLLSVHYLLPPPHTSHLCLVHVYPHFLFYFFLSISLHSVLSPYLHSSLPFHLTCSFYLRHIFLLERKKKLKSKTVDLPRCFALSYKIPKSTRFFFLFTFQYQRLAQEFSGSKN